MPPRFVIFVLFALGSAQALEQADPFREAAERFRARHYDQALAFAQKALEQDSSNPAYLHLYGSILAAIERFDSAEENLGKAATLAPRDAEYAYDLGALLHQRRKYAEALPILRRAVELAPGNLPARMMLARSYVFSYRELKIPNFVALTLEQLNYIVEHDPRFPAVHHHLALVYINSGEFDKALPELHTELQHYPGNAQARLELGETLLKLNQNHQATEQLLIAARQAPQVAPVHYALAKAYKADGQRTKAVDAVRRCVELDPRLASCHLLLGQLYRDLNQLDQAKEQLQLFEQLKQAGSQNN